MTQQLIHDPSTFLREHAKEYGLVLYNRMSQAIEACDRVDEAKEIRDKARAIEVYAAQALNYEAENTACKIRLRAERRCGELLRDLKAHDQLAMGKHNRPYQKQESDHTTLAELGISKQQSSDWQKLAAIPKEEFEARLNDNGQKPSTHELILKPEPERLKIPVSNDALSAWGRICDFEREELLDQDPRELYDNMLDTMQADIQRILPRLIPWLKELLP